MEIITISDVHFSKIWTKSLIDKMKISLVVIKMVIILTDKLSVDLHFMSVTTDIWTWKLSPCPMSTFQKFGQKF